MMKVAYFSPLNPQISGISDFSEELLPELAKYMDIDLFVDDFKPSNQYLSENFTIHNIEDIENKNVRDQYGCLIYHIGNSSLHSKIVQTFLKYPGICELHDICLHHFLAEETIAKGKVDDYIKAMKYCHGITGEKRAVSFAHGESAAPWENESMDFPVNKYILDKATAVIVHSDFAKQNVKAVNPGVPVVNIPLHSEIIENYKNKMEVSRTRFGIKNSQLVCGSFGFASKEKRILSILDALSMLKENGTEEFLYLIVGEARGIDIDKVIKERKLEENVKITGYVTLDEFRDYMEACDFCFNLRYPTQGESSASLSRMLGMGKPVIVTQIGAFEEYPDLFVKKVPADREESNHIYLKIKEIIAELKKNAYLSKDIIDYAITNFDLCLNAKKYDKFINSLIQQSWKEDFIDNIVDIIFELGLSNEYTKTIITRSEYMNDI